MQKKKKRLDYEIPPYIYIVSEGTKTEPYYIRGLVNAINAKYYNYGSERRIEVKGTGRSTLSLLQYARNQVENEWPQATVFVEGKVTIK